jgi:hypothetical protein
VAWGARLSTVAVISIAQPGCTSVHRLNVKRVARSIDQLGRCNQAVTVIASTERNRLPATPAPHQRFAQRGPDHLRTRAELLIRTLSEEDSLATRSQASALEFIVDGYAHVLALDVDCMRLEREIAQLALSGDPSLAGELRELSALLAGVSSTSEQLRQLLDAARLRVEARG